MSEQRKIFFSGIAGSGMSALALFALSRGVKVSGSDRLFDNSGSGHIRERLENAGISIFPQDGSGIHEGLSLMVMSTAVETDRPEVVAARQTGVPVMTRPEFLASLASDMDTIAIAGTSGKSTASGMLAHAMRELGLSPNFIGGGRVVNFKDDFNTGNMLAGESELLVIEADESDGSIVNYRPATSVILNLSLDHNPVSETSRMFTTLMNNTSGHVILNADDKALMDIAPEGTVTFSIESPSDFRAEEIKHSGLGSIFMAKGQGFRLSVPGRHNVLNALSAIAMLSSMRQSMPDIARALESFRGIERRMDVKLDNNGLVVMDDYAHNPHKISAMMNTVRNMADSACYIFQPHGFGPLKMMLDEYARTFNELLRPDDRLYVLPVYYAGGTVSQETGSHSLAELCRAEAPNNREELIKAIRTEPLYGCYVTFGARDETLSDLASEIARIVAKMR